MTRIYPINIRSQEDGHPTPDGQIRSLNSRAKRQSGQRTIGGSLRNSFDAAPQCGRLYLAKMRAEKICAEGRRKSRGKDAQEAETKADTINGFL